VYLLLAFLVLCGEDAAFEGDGEGVEGVLPSVQGLFG